MKLKTLSQSREATVLQFSQHPMEVEQCILPSSENITSIVNNNAIKVIGLILGMNFFSYHSLLFNLNKVNRVIIPARNGMPR